MVPNADTFQGREAITNAIQGLIDAGVTKIELNTHEIEDLGKTAIEHGEFALYAGENVADKVGSWFIGLTLMATGYSIGI
jgi:ketosteroid isomerase-like protein